jgi:N-acyl-D-amino-acid deacylase
MMELVIKGGTICDGSGSPLFKSDIAIAGGRIQHIGEMPSRKAQRVIDAEGLTVSPGFIDIHGHTDENILISPRAESKIHQGVTTEVAGNCGVSPAPLYGEFREEFTRDLKSRYDMSAAWESCEDFFALLSRQGLGINYCMLVGNGNIRGGVVGFRERRPRDAELETMLNILKDSLGAGAWGLSSGLIYVPSCFSTKEELITLAGSVARIRGIYATHMRGEGDSLIEAVAEALEIAEGSGVSLEISHLKASGERNWGKLEEVLALIDESQKRGARCGCDQYPYTASSTGLGSVLPHWVREGGKDMFLRKIGDQSIRERVKAEMADPPDWSRIVISSSRKRNARFLGKNVKEFSEIVGKSPLDAVFDLLIDEDDEVAALFFAQSEENVEKIMRLPFTAIGTDAAARAPHGPLSTDLPHPRAYGTFPRVLGHYVRERGVLTLREAVRKMTSLPAARLGLGKRGVLRQGWWADMTVFRADAIGERATYGDPHQYPEGIEYVIVNGRIVIDRGEHTGALPGRVLRRGIKES